VKSIWLERALIMVASLVLSIGLIILLSGYFTSRDQAGVTGTQSRIGLQFPDLGHRHLSPDEPHPLYNSNPPTSGAHLDVPVTRDETRLSDDQLLQALEEGNIVVVYGGRLPPPGLTVLARAIAGPFTAALARAGQAVILDRRPGTVGLIGLAWTRVVNVSAPNDSLLRQFAEVWLGRGAAAS
jgi:hypothetical protein